MALAVSPPTIPRPGARLGRCPVAFFLSCGHCSCKKSFLSTYHVPGAVLGIGLER